MIALFTYYSSNFRNQVLNPLDAVCDRKRTDAICVSNLKNARKSDKGVLVERPDVKIFLPFRFFFYRVDELFRPNTYNRYLVATGGDHLISLIDEISYVSPPSPMLSQMEDIPPEQFCNFATVIIDLQTVAWIVCAPTQLIFRWMQLLRLFSLMKVPKIEFIPKSSKYFFSSYIKI